MNQLPLFIHKGQEPEDTVAYKLLDRLYGGFVYTRVQDQTRDGWNLAYRLEWPRHSQALLANPQVHPELGELSQGHEVIVYDRIRHNGYPTETYLVTIRVGERDIPLFVEASDLYSG